MKDLKKIIFRLLAANCLFLCLMSVYRLIFFIHFGKGIDLHGLSFDILKAFFMGTRLDLSIIAFINSPIVLVFVVILISGRYSIFKLFFSFLNIYYCILIGLMLTVFCVDFNFYSYFQEHLNILVFGLFEDDTQALIKTFYQNYNLLLIGTCIFSFFVAAFFISKFALKFKEHNFKFPNTFTRIGVSLLIVIFSVITMRGTLKIRPICEYAFDVSANTFINKTTVNCFYTLEGAFEHKFSEKGELDYVERAGYKDNVRKAFADFLGKNINKIPHNSPEQSLIFKTAYNPEVERVKPNVIFIVMESFGGDSIKYNSPQFNILGGLKKHFDEDIVFHNFVSEGTITVRAMEALFLNIVPRASSSVYIPQSKYVFRKYLFASTVPYKDIGYDTFFICSGNCSWRNTGVFASNMGFNKVFGEGCFKPSYARGPWGVFDEYLFDEIFKNLTSENGKVSKFIFALTTSNHAPYILPRNYKILPLEIPQSLKEKICNIKEAGKRFAAYQYANEMLARFITRVKNSKYADNTIIAVTGDHNFNLYQIDSLLDKAKVPFYLYVPKSLKPKNIDTSVFGSHLDIMPTLYNLSLSNKSYMSEGTDLFSNKAKDNAIIHQDFIMDKSFAVHWNFLDNKAKYYVWDKNYVLKDSNKTDEHEKLKKRLLSMFAISDYLIKNTGE